MAKSLLYFSIRPQVQQLIEHYSSLGAFPQLALTAPGQLNLGSVDWAGILSKFVATVTNLVSTLAGTPEDKKQAVVDAAEEFYQTALKPVLANAVGLPFIFNTFIEPNAEKAVVALAGGLYAAIDGVVTRLTTGGGTLAPAPAPAPAPGAPPAPPALPTPY